MPVKDCVLSYSSPNKLFKRYAPFRRIFGIPRRPGRLDTPLERSFADTLVLALALVLNYDEGFSGWPIANILMLAAVRPTWLLVRLITQGATAVFVVIVGHFALRRLARPSLAIVLLYILSLLLDIATFVYCFMHFPYDQCRNGSYSSSSKGCKVDKAAVPIVGVLMYDLSSTALNIRGLFFISSVILLYDFVSWHRRGYGNSAGGYNSGGNVNGSKSRRSRFYY